MRTSEIVVVAYFTYVAVAAALSIQVRAERRRFVIATAVAIGALVVALSLAPAGPVSAVLRDSLPLAYVLIGYWLPALLTRAPRAALERWLHTVDDRLRLRGDAPSPIDGVPRAWLKCFELSYLLCYLLVPMAFAVLYFLGGSAETDRFWTTVLLAVYSCYGLLPWVPTRAPRALEGPSRLDRQRSRIRALNLWVLRRGSVEWNTFPSGHAAGGVSAALSVVVEMPIVGVVLLLLALSIMIGSVLGRYHYAADAIAGAIVAIAATVVATFIT